MKKKIINKEIYIITEKKKIIDLIHNKWINLAMYSLGTFIGGVLIYKFVSK
jgi:hypothetical protein